MSHLTGACPITRAWALAGACWQCGAGTYRRQGLGGAAHIYRSEESGPGPSVFLCSEVVLPPPGLLPLPGARALAVRGHTGALATEGSPVAHAWWGAPWGEKGTWLVQPEFVSYPQPCEAWPFRGA